MIMAKRREGMAYPFMDHDENIYPNMDLSYIDERIHRVLGHHLKDFEGEISAKNLGPRYGEYGSFLPMYRRSPSTFSKQKTSQEVGHHTNSESLHSHPSEAANQHFGDQHSGTLHAGHRPSEMILENWVCCDKCQKWRLLPQGINPDELPTKWICGMLSWLPGMNKCSINEETTTSAVHALDQVPDLNLQINQQNQQNVREVIVTPETSEKEITCKKRKLKNCWDTCNYAANSAPKEAKYLKQSANGVENQKNVRKVMRLETSEEEITLEKRKLKDCWDACKYAANNALKEVKYPEQSANCVKISESGISTELFFQASLNFLHGASLLEPQHGDTAKYGEMKSIEAYGTTAKLFEYCAHDYERCNNMASAALAYKCLEVSYMRLIYSNDFTASKDWCELQMALQMVPSDQSPSSSASSVDILNHQAIDDKTGVGQDGDSPQLTGDHIFSAKNQPCFIRLLDFAQNVNMAMEASKKSGDAFATASVLFAKADNSEAIFAIKRVLDFSFHDVEEFLVMVRHAMEAIKQ